MQQLRCGVASLGLKEDLLYGKAKLNISGAIL